MQITGVLFNADALALERMNEVVAKLPLARRGALRLVVLLQLRPSRDLGKLAGEYAVELPAAFRWERG